jgi:hypothetical protein
MDWVLAMTGFQCQVKSPSRWTLISDYLQFTMDEFTRPVISRECGVNPAPEAKPVVLLLPVLRRQRSGFRGQEEELRGSSILP